MDHLSLRNQLNELQLLGSTIMEEVKSLEMDALVISEASYTFEKFTSLIEEAILSSETNSKIVEEALSSIERFRGITSQSIDAEALLGRYKCEITERLQQSTDGIADFAKPYSLFVAIVEKPELDLSEQEYDLVEKFFGPTVTRPLYRGKFSFIVGAKSENDSNLSNDNKPVTPNFLPSPTQPAVPPLSTKPEENEPTIEDKYAIVTEKTNLPFSPKAFISDYVSSANRNGGVTAIIHSRRGELELLHIFARLGFLTKHQLQTFVYNDQITDSSFRRIYKNGLISSIKHIHSGTEFYALSKKGTEVFKKEKSLKVMSKVASIKREIWCNNQHNLMKMDTDMNRWERTNSIALYIQRFCWQEFSSCDLERVSTDQHNNIVIIEMQPTLEPKQDDSQASLKKTTPIGFVLFTIADKISLSPTDATTNPLLKQKERLTQFINNPDKKVYICGIADDGTTVEFLDSDGNTVSFKDILSHLLPGVGFPHSCDPLLIVGVDPETTGQNNDNNLLPFSEAGLSPEPKTSCRSEDKPPLFVKNEITGLEFPMTADDEPSLIAKNLLEGRILPAEQEPFDVLLRSLLRKAADANESNTTDYLGRAVVLSKALSLANQPLYAENYKRLLLATDFPLDTRNYTYKELFALFAEEHEGTGLHLAALLRALFNPASEDDGRVLYQYAEGMLKNFDSVFKELEDLKSTFSAFLEIKKVSHCGFTDRLTSHFIDAQAKNEALLRLAEKAKSLRELRSNPKQIKGSENARKECLGKDSLLGECIKIISENNIKERNFVYEAFSHHSDHGLIVQETIETELDNAWQKHRPNHSDRRLGYEIRKTIIREYNERLEIIKNWLNLTDASTEASNSELPKIVSKLKTILNEVIKNLRSNCHHEDRAVLIHTLSNLLAKLNGKGFKGFIPEDWLSIGILPLKYGIPVVDDTFSHIQYYEPWRNVLRHIEQSPQDLSLVLRRIETPGDPLFDNLGQAIMICEYRKKSEQADYHKDFQYAQCNVESEMKAFLEKYERECHYGCVDEQSKESAFEELESLKHEFLESNDFARLRHFIGALRQTLDEEIERNRSYWADEINRRRETNPGEYLDRAESFLNRENASFILVEDVLNNHDSNDIKGEDMSADETGLFAEFIDEVYFNELYTLCFKNKDKSLHSFAKEFVKDKLRQAGLSTLHFDSADNLTKSIPPTPQIDGSSGIKVMLKELGFTVKEVIRSNANSSPARFVAKMIPDSMNNLNYKHPIAALGTRIESDFCVIEMFGRVEPASIISEVRGINEKNAIPIVFLNGFLSLAQRRQLAKYFLKDGKAANPFILMDWVLLLHLATKLEAERLKTMLACSLPYTGIKQLFSITSTIPVADEMYIGRSDEIAKILDMNGPVIVYGGRQLGKTALLQRAKNRFHVPQKNFSIFVNAGNDYDETDFVQNTFRELSKAGINIQPANSIMEICKELSEWFKQGDRKLLLLVDEADKLLAALSKERNYAPLVHLEDLCKFAPGKFKFVFAGLHNVFLAANDPNTIFGHFGAPLCIKPMSRTDAFRLLSRPLNYLGFLTNPDILLPLLINTNFYPGVIHFVGTKLVDMLMNEYESHYKDNINPPYELKELQIGAIVKSSELTKWVNDRLRWTLMADPSYYAIAKYVAYLYDIAGEKRGRGYSVDEIINCPDDLGLNDFSNMSRENCSNLLSEMCDMNILVEKSGYYRFRLSRFLNIFGRTPDERFEQLDKPEVIVGEQ